MSNNKDLFDQIFESANSVVDKSLGIERTEEPKENKEPEQPSPLGAVAKNVFTGEVAVFDNQSTTSQDDEEIDWSIADEELDDSDEYAVNHFYGDPLTEQEDDDFDELLGEEFSEKLVTSRFKIEDSIEERVVNNNPRSFDLTEEEEVKFKRVVEESKNRADIDTNSDMPNINEEEVSEYIVMRGIYTPAFKEHILNSPVVIDGDFPLCIEVKGKTIVYRRINPDPHTLFYLTKVFRGWEIKHVKDSEERDLNIMYFLGKIKIGVK